MGGPGPATCEVKTKMFLPCPDHRQELLTKSFLIKHFPSQDDACTQLSGRNGPHSPELKEQKRNVPKCHFDGIFQIKYIKRILWLQFLVLLLVSNWCMRFNLNFLFHLNCTKNIIQTTAQKMKHVTKCIFSTFYWQENRLWLQWKVFYDFLNFKKIKSTFETMNRKLWDNKGVNWIRKPYETDLIWFIGQSLFL